MEWGGSRKYNWEIFERNLAGLTDPPYHDYREVMVDREVMFFHG